MVADVSPTLPVELNNGSVHAIDAPRSFTAEGPFHVEFDNLGGAVHVHLHFDDDLSRISRVDEVNHYIEADATKRVPIGVVPNQRPVTGRLKVVTGYGAEVAYVELTVRPKTTQGSQSTMSPADRGQGHQNKSQSTDGQGEPQSRASDSSTSTSDGGPTVVRRRTPTKRRRDGAHRPGGHSRLRALRQRARDLPVDSLPTRIAAVRPSSTEGVVFFGLAAVAVLIGVGVVSVVRELLLTLVVLAVIAVAVGVAGWLLLE